MNKVLALIQLLLLLFCISFIPLKAAQKQESDGIKSIEQMTRKLSLTQSHSSSEFGSQIFQENKNQHSATRMACSDSTEKFPSVIELPSVSELPSASPQKPTVTCTIKIKKAKRESLFTGFQQRKDCEVKSLEIPEDDENLLFIHAAETGNTQEIKTILNDNQRYSQLQIEFMLHGLEQAFKNGHGIEVLVTFLLSENIQKDLYKKITYIDLGFIFIDALKYDDTCKVIDALLKPSTLQEPSLIREPAQMVYDALVEISRTKDNQEFLSIIPKIFKGKLLAFLQEEYLSIPSYATLLAELFIRTVDTMSLPIVELFFRHPILGGLNPSIKKQIHSDHPLYNDIVNHFKKHGCGCVIL